MTVRVELLGMFADAGTGASVVLLGERNDVTHVLPIFIGPAEAQSIAMAMQGLTPDRPGTHDLMIAMMQAMDGELARVTVTDLADGAFLAELDFETPNGPRPISSRPSDGIALAIRVGAPVHVAEAVLDEAAVEVTHDVDTPFSEEEVEAIVTEFDDFLTTLEPEDFVEHDAQERGDKDDDAGSGQ